jgi:HK97 family phage major capsid protein
MSQLEELSKAMTTAQARHAESIKNLQDEVLALAQKIAARPGAGSISDESTDDGRLVEIITKSADFEALRAGKIRDLRVPIPGGLGIKTQIVNATGASQPLVAADRVAELIVPGRVRLTIRDIIPALPTLSNVVEFTSEATYTNAARAQGDASPGGVEGEAFAESAMTFSLASAAVVTLGHWIPASQQVLDDSTVLRDTIGNTLLYGLKLTEDQQLLTGTGAAGAINGLNNQATAFTGGVTNASILDTLARAKTQLELANYAANGVVLNPADFLAMVTAKDSQLRYVYGDPKMGAIPTVWGIPIVISNSMTSGRFLMGDFQRAARIWDRQEAMVEFSTGYQDFFTRHMVAIKAWERVTLTVYRSSALVYGNTSHAG